ncbi:glycosyl transferase family 1 [Priestia megaterium]|uniref:Glycosyl transferase family 1 n=1 Tax=Priestia megaterium TaxID=1404 RepID=A0AA86I869_PRIMG|nr:glycosyltransferase family 4 protein [Priestia megaterium]AXI32065.1 glycosyl transferase family 1 [Priestia megaterium]
MKILLISNMYPSEQFPNYGVFVQNTKKILVKNDIKVDLAVMYKQTNKVKKLTSYALHYGRVLWKGLFGTYDYLYVHYASHNALPVLILKKFRRNIKVITNIHGSDVVPKDLNDNQFESNVKKLLQLSNKIISPSIAYKELIKNKYNLTNSIYVFPSGGVDPDIFYSYNNKEEAKKKLNLNPDQKVIGCVSRIDSGKGWEYFLQAISLLENDTPTSYHYLYVGSGVEEEKFKAMMVKLNLHSKVTHLPALPQPELVHVYNAIDAFIFPSKAESLGLVGLEAMACGAPVIGSKVGGLQDYIHPRKNGLFFEKGDIDELAFQIRSFINLSDEEKNRMSLASIETARDYDLNKVSTILPEIFLNQATQNA